IHYLYDLETYQKERGLNLSEEELPGTIAKTTEELVAAVDNHLVNDSPSEHYLAGKRRFCPYDDGESTERVVRWLFYEDESYIEFVDPSASTKSLFLVGNMSDPASFSELTKDLTRIDEHDEVITLLFSGDLRKDKDKEQLVSTINNSNINFIVHDKNMPTTIEEAFAISVFNQNGSFMNDYMKNYHDVAFKREFRRIFGDTHFNKIKNLEIKLSFYKSLCLRTPTE